MSLYNLLQIIDIESILWTIEIVIIYVLDNDVQCMYLQNKTVALLFFFTTFMVSIVVIF